jgi:hypothetical protein
MANEAARNAEEQGVRTHLFKDPQGRAAGLYQLQKSRAGGTEIPYFVSDVPGLGKAMLEDAYFMAPEKPVSLYAIPGSEDFYRKFPEWVENNSDGISKFIRKAKGGLVQMKECSCRK